MPLSNAELNVLYYQSTAKMLIIIKICSHYKSVEAAIKTRPGRVAQKYACSPPIVLWMMLQSVCIHVRCGCSVSSVFFVVFLLSPSATLKAELNFYFWIQQLLPFPFSLSAPLSSPLPHSSQPPPPSLSPSRSLPYYYYPHFLIFTRLIWNRSVISLQHAAHNKLHWSCQLML